MRRTGYPVIALTGLLLAAATTFDAQQAPTRVVITKHFTAADQVNGRYQYVPFDLPIGVTRLHVSYSYDKANGANVVDLGLFEPGPLDLSTRAFRGYSGGARADAWIDKSGAAPGYREGPIPAGRWHVLLGLYRIAPAGVDATLTIEWETGGVVPFADHEARRPPEAAPDRRWYTGALHTHTVHSDGTLTPGELLRRFQEKGFDFVAITDHNNTTHTQSLRRDAPEPTQVRPLLRIIGEEVTTPGGHANVWGLPENGWVDFRVMPGDPRIRDLVAAARTQGAMVAINHPASECLACGWTHDVVDGIEGIEISNGRHGEVAKAIAMWDRLLMSGRRITGVGSSDWHSAPNPIDNAHVRVYAETLTQEAILGAIRAGRVIVMTDARDATPEIVVRAASARAVLGDSLAVPDGTHLDVQVNAPAAARGHLVMVTNGQRGQPIPLDADGLALGRLAPATGYVRFELLRADGTPAAFTNPVYLVR